MGRPRSEQQYKSRLLLVRVSQSSDTGWNNGRLATSIWYQGTARTSHAGGGWATEEGFNIPV